MPDAGVRPLRPAEHMALTVAKGMVKRGENPGIAITGMLVMTVERLAGIADYTMPRSKPMPDIPGPFATEREADRAAHELGGPPREGWSILSEAQREAMLLAACASAGVELGDYDKRVIRWLSRWEDSVCGVVAALVLRAGSSKEKSDA